MTAALTAYALGVVLAYTFASYDRDLLDQRPLFKRALGWPLCCAMGVVVMWRDMHEHERMANDA
jgi:predicted outer membrane lipoprotein